MSGGSGGITSRRSLLQALAASAVLPSLAHGVTVQAQAIRAFTPPNQPLRFSRKLIRNISGGQAITVTRSYEVRFVAQPGGYRVEGAQVSAEVDAPESLAALAQIEQQRRDTGLFPMELGLDGLIFAGTAGQAAPDLARAVDIALEKISAANIHIADKDSMRAFVLNLQKVASSLSSSAPADLFVPPEIPHEVSRQLVLPDGSVGMVSTRFSGTVHPDTGLLKMAERVITTMMQEAERKTVEQWRLDPA